MTSQSVKLPKRFGARQPLTSQDDACPYEDCIPTGLVEVRPGYSDSDRCSESADCTKLESPVYVEVHGSWNMYRGKNDTMESSDSWEKQSGPERSAFEPFGLSCKDTDGHEHIVPIQSFSPPCFEARGII